jgi:hypothetical protein
MYLPSRGVEKSWAVVEAVNEFSSEKRNSPPESLGWREAPGWFRNETQRHCGFGTTPRVIALQSRCPNLGGQFSSLPQIQFIHIFIDRAQRETRDDWIIFSVRFAL